MGTSYPSSAVVKRDPLNVETTPSALTESLTANDAFYVRTNFGVPALATSEYSLRLRGIDGTEHRVSLRELAGMDPVDVAVTLECAGNHRSGLVPLPPGETWRGGAVATAVWRGVPLGRVLQRYKLIDSAREFVFTGADAGIFSAGAPVPFQRALSAELALAEGPLLAFEMNGAPLPPAHGAPLRLIMPGWYAMASVKWLVSIDALSARFDGYFQTQRYVYRTGNAEQAVREMRVKSIITDPAADSIVQAGRTTVRGWAWSGSAPIEAVHVATRGGGAWEAARLGPDVSRWSWRRWEFDWAPDAAGHHILRSRATDANGATQPDVAEWNDLGYGNNAIQTHSVFVL